MKNIFKKTIISSIAVFFCFTLFASQAMAINAGVEATKGKSGKVLKAESLTVYVAGLTRAALGVVGIVALLVVAYGGIMYLTSAGSQEKIKTSLKLLFYGGVGMALIFGAYTMSSFVIKALQESTMK